MNKRGFTLMEVLAVLLVLAVIASLAVPGIRAANYEVKNSRAKTAAKRLLEGMRNYKQATRGGTVTFPAAGFNGTFSSACTVPVNTGIPGQAAQVSIDVDQLAVCGGFVSPKDFRGLPYLFYNMTPSGITISGNKGDVTLVVVGTDKAGPKYNDRNKYLIYMDDRLEPIEFNPSKS